MLFENHYQLSRLSWLSQSFPFILKNNHFLPFSLCIQFVFCSLSLSHLFCLILSPSMDPKAVNISTGVAPSTYSVQPVPLTAVPLDPNMPQPVSAQPVPLTAVPLDPNMPQAYPIQPMVTEPVTQAIPAEPIPAQPMSAQPMPAQPIPAQPMVADPMAQPMPAQPAPMQAIPTQGYPAQPMPAQPAPMQAIPAQGYPVPAVVTQSMPAQPGLAPVNVVVPLQPNGVVRLPNQYLLPSPLYLLALSRWPAPTATSSSTPMSATRPALSSGLSSSFSSSSSPSSPAACSAATASRIRMHWDDLCKLPSVHYCPKCGKKIGNVDEAVLITNSV